MKKKCPCNTCAYLTTKYIDINDDEDFHYHCSKLGWDNVSLDHRMCDKSWQVSFATEERILGQKRSGKPIIVRL